MPQIDSQSLKDSNVRVSIAEPEGSTSQSPLQDSSTSTASIIDTPVLYVNDSWTIPLESLRKTQDGVPVNPPNGSRCPTHNDFKNLPSSMTVTILPQRIDRLANHCVLVLYLGDVDKEALTHLSLRIQEEFDECVCIMLRIPHENSPVLAERYGSGTPNDLVRGSISLSEIILINTLKQGLVSNCGFPPSSIVIFGHGEAGTAGLTFISIWYRVEFGGVIFIDGRMPALHPTISTAKPKTPVLMLSSSKRVLKEEAMGRMSHCFDCLNFENMFGNYEKFPGHEDMHPLLQFLGHRFRHDEWTKQAITSFDGGGIRGYGSLLIYRKLMEKVAKEERRLDATTESSFSPCIYKPTKPKYRDRYTWRRAPKFHSLSSDLPEANIVTGSDTNLRDTSLFLPCHYFDYGAGTSTGGLITIMLFCLRMTVDDCLKEYEAFGDKIFGHPRRMSCKGLLWPKFSSKDFEKVIQEAAARHNTTGHLLGYAIERDLCQCMVLAYPQHPTRGDIPYLFRTYEPPTDARDEMYERFRPDSRFHPFKTPLSRVAQATSAAPTYFSPVEIDCAHRGVRQDPIRFKDGGFGSNNPSEEAYNDIVYLHGGVSKSIGLFVSVGTGGSQFTLFSKKKGNLFDWWANLMAARKRPSLTTLAHRSMERHARRDGRNVFPYYRFDGGDVLGKLPLDAWETDKPSTSRWEKVTPGAKTLREIKAAVEQYLEKEGVGEALEACAKALVQRRRLRTRDSDRWERYAATTYYVCDHTECKDVRPLPPFLKSVPFGGAAHYNTALAFKSHWEKVHGPVAVQEHWQEKLDACKQYDWLYPGWNKSDALA